MSNVNKTYHKGTYRAGEWAKHVRPYIKRLGNKRWRQTGKAIEILEDELIKVPKAKRNPKVIKVLITKEYVGGFKSSIKSRYRTLRDAENAMKQAHVINAVIQSKGKNLANDE